MEGDVLQNFIKMKSNGVGFYREKLLTMLGSSKYKFAEPLLSSIYNYIEETGSISDKQKKAVDSIYDGANKPRDKASFKRRATRPKPIH